MDPITGAVVAIVLWFFAIYGGWIISYAVGVIGGFIFGSDTSTFVGAVIGWLLGAAWAIFAVVQFILAIVHLIQLIAGG